MERDEMAQRVAKTSSRRRREPRHRPPTLWRTASGRPEVVLHSENGVIGITRRHRGGGDYDLINAGKQPVTCCRAAPSHMPTLRDDAAPPRHLRARRSRSRRPAISRTGTPARWSIRGRRCDGSGDRRRRTVGTTRRANQVVRPAYPLTGVSVSRIYTELAIIDDAARLKWSRRSRAGFDELQAVPHNELTIPNRFTETRR